jgi:hypothetical protein
VEERDPGPERGQVSDDGQILGLLTDLAQA